MLPSTRIVFEEKEKREPMFKEDCLLSSITLISEGERRELGILKTERAAGTNVETNDKGSGPSVLMVSKSTSCEYQKVDAITLHRATTDVKLAAFLEKTLPIIEAELHLSSLLRQLTSGVTEQ